MKKIIHVVERLNDEYGGPAKSVPYTAYYSSDSNAKHEVVCGFTQPFSENTVCSQLDISVTYCRIIGPQKIGFSLDYVYVLWIILKKGKNCSIHLHNMWNFFPFYVFILHKFFKFEIYYSIRGALFPWSLEQGKWRKKISWILFQKKLLKLCKVVHVTSEQELCALQKIGVSENVIKIPNGIPIKSDELEITRIRQKQRNNAKVLNIIFASRIHPKKGVDILLSSVKSIIDINISIKLAGPTSENDYLNSLRCIISTLPQNISVEFLGHCSTDTLSQLFLQADLFVLPSHTENFGIVIAEALSHGLPVITSTETPWSEITAERAGYIVPVDTDSLCLAIRNFAKLTDYQRAEMSFNAQKIVRKYAWDKLANKYKSIYGDKL